MSCEDYREIISAYCDGEESAGETVVARSHLESCGDCRRMVAEWQAVRLPRTMPAPRVTERFAIGQLAARGRARRVALVMVAAIVMSLSAAGTVLAGHGARDRDAQRPLVHTNGAAFVAPSNPAASHSGKPVPQTGSSPRRHAQTARAAASGLPTPAGDPGLCFGKQPTIVGTAGDDTITGTPGDDVIAGMDGNDHIDGRGGHDRICGGPGDDTIVDGDPGPPPSSGSIVGATPCNDCDDKISGGDGQDSITSTYGPDIVEGDDGDDTITGSADPDIIDGGAGNDVLHGGDGPDSMDGGSGDDTIYGDAAPDSIEGGDGADRIWGGDDADSISGGAGNDVIDGGAGPDSISGDEGNDTMSGGSGPDSIAGGDGTDSADGGSDWDSCSAERTSNCES